MSSWSTDLPKELSLGSDLDDGLADCQNSSLIENIHPAILIYTYPSSTAFIARFEYARLQRLNYDVLAGSGTILLVWKSNKLSASFTILKFQSDQDYQSLNLSMTDHGVRLSS